MPLHHTAARRVNNKGEPTKKTGLVIQTIDTCSGVRGMESVFVVPLHSPWPYPITAGRHSTRSHISITQIEIVTQVRLGVMEEHFPHNDMLLILDFSPHEDVTLRAARENYLPAPRQRSGLYLFIAWFFNTLTCFSSDNYYDSDVQSFWLALWWMNVCSNRLRGKGAPAMTVNDEH